MNIRIFLFSVLWLILISLAPVVAINAQAEIGISPKQKRITYKIIDLVIPESTSGRTDDFIQYASSINELGQIAGHCYCKINNEVLPFFLWNEKTGYTFKNTGWKGSVHPADQPYINDNGTLSMHPINNKEEVYFVDDKNKLRKNNVIVESSLKWHNICPLRVNNSGQVLGSVETSNGHIILVVWSEPNNTITYIHPQLKFNLNAAGINDKGWVVGWYQEDGWNVHGVLWTPEFGAQIIKNFQPAAINNSGVIAGKICQIGGQRKAALWVRGQIIDLSDELKIETNPETKLLRLTDITGINDLGQMVGWGNGSIPNTNRAFFITPIN